MLQAVRISLVLAIVSCQDVGTEVVDYLTQYGYIPTPKNGAKPFIDKTTLTQAVKEFQTFGGLDPSGELDSDTLELMKTPRCGSEDKVANFVLQGSNWKKKVITYRILQYPTARGLSRRDVDKETRKAFSMWQRESSLRFEEKTFGSADIEIKFVKGNHGDGNPFDGRGGVLAHAFYPRYGGDAHFDDDEPWSVTPNRGNQVLNTLTHEFGHSLGLSHSRVKGSIMAPFYKGWDVNLRLAEDDKKGIRALYGPPQGGNPFPTDRPERFPTRTTTFRSVGGVPNPLCGSMIDAAIQTSDRESYVFSGDSYWKLDSDRIASGYPRKISQDWPGLPNNIDAAVTWRGKGVTYFFKGEQYWRFTDKSPAKGYPRDISIWQKLPANLDAAFTWGDDEHLFFFKGSQYWKFDIDKGRIDSDYPKSISVWKDLPSSPEAALRWSNGRTYVFKSGNYWRLNDQTGHVDNSNPPFPRNAGQWWFGCPKTTFTIPLFDGTKDYDTEH